MAVTEHDDGHGSPEFDPNSLTTDVEGGSASDGAAGQVILDAMAGELGREQDAYQRARIWLDDLDRQSQHLGLAVKDHDLPRAVRAARVQLSTLFMMDQSATFELARSLAQAQESDERWPEIASHLERQIAVIAVQLEAALQGVELPAHRAPQDNGGLRCDLCEHKALHIDGVHYFCSNGCPVHPYGYDRDVDELISPTL